MMEWTVVSEVFSCRYVLSLSDEDFPRFLSDSWTESGSNIPKDSNTKDKPASARSPMESSACPVALPSKPSST